jgi:hypothetical protein
MGRPPLTARRLRQLLSYDPATGEFRWRVRVSIRVQVGQIAGRINGDGYVRIGVDGSEYFASRLACLWMEGWYPEHLVEHINGQRHDNRWENLRKPPRSPRRRRDSSPSHAAAAE